MKRVLLILLLMAATSTFGAGTGMEDNLVQTYADKSRESTLPDEIGQMSASYRTAGGTICADTGKFIPYTSTPLEANNQIPGWNVTPI